MAKTGDRLVRPCSPGATRDTYEDEQPKLLVATTRAGLVGPCQGWAMTRQGPCSEPRAGELGGHRSSCCASPSVSSDSRCADASRFGCRRHAYAVWFALALLTGEFC